MIVYCFLCDAIHPFSRQNSLDVQVQGGNLRKLTILLGPMTSPDRKRLYPSTVGHAAGCRTSVEAYVGILEVYPGRFGTHPVGRSYQARTVLFDSTNHLRLSVAGRSSGPSGY